MSARNDVSAARRFRRGMPIGAASLGLIVAGCAVGPDFDAPAPPSLGHYSSGSDPAVTVTAGGVAQRFRVGESAPDAWWHLFKSRALDDVIAQSVKDNPGLAAAQESLKAAQDNLRSGYGVFFPQIGADYSAAREKYSPLKLGQNAQAPLFNLFSLSGTISYAIDIFGGERRAVEALGAQADAEDAAERAAYLTLTSNVADAVIARAAYLAEIEATSELIALEAQQVELAKTQFRAGTVPYANVLSLEAELESNEATIPGLKQKVAQADDLLAALSGHAAAEWRASAVRFSELSLPGDLPVSLPSQLVRQRPDIVEAEATMHGASAEIGVATAAMLPSITLSASSSANASAMSGLFATKGSAWSLAGDATAPLFEGGTLWFKRKAAVDEYRQSAALYRQTVLAAFQQVADTLQALDHDAQALQAQDKALATAKTALQLREIDFRAGLNTGLDVINADVQYHQAVIARIEAAAARYQDTVALFASLGGGWWSGPPTAKAG